MKFTTHNDTKIDADYTSFQGGIKINYATLVNVFGKPDVGDGYKTDAEWIIQFANGVVATIYNYKDGQNYNGASGTKTENIRDWHIGGRDNVVVDMVKGVIEEYKKNAKKPVKKEVKKTAKAMSELEYVKKGGCRCPFCGSEDIVGQSVEIDAGGAIQECSCAECDKEWYDHYKLSGYEEI